MANVYFSKNGSSYIEAMNRGMSTKFVLLIDIDVPKAVTSTNTKPEVVLNMVDASFSKREIVISQP